MARIYGSCWGSNANKYTIWIDYTVVSQNINNNTSTVNAKMYVRRNDGYAQSAYNLNGKQYRCIKYDNSNVRGGNGNVDTRNGQNYLLYDTTYTIKHNPDGSKGITLQGEFYISGVSGLTGGSVSQWINFPKIQRASHPTVNSFTLGEPINIKTNRSYSGFSHTITLNINGKDIRTVENVGNDVTILLDDEELNTVYTSMKSQLTSTATVKCTTYNGSSNIGTNNGTCTCSVDKTKCQPNAFKFNYGNANESIIALVGGEYNGKTLIKGISNLIVTIPPTDPRIANNGADIVKLRLVCGKIVTEADVHEAYINDVELSISMPTSEVVDTSDFTITAIDSRGLERSHTGKFTLIDYTPIKISDASVERVDGIEAKSLLNVSAKIWDKGFIDCQDLVTYFAYRVKYKSEGGSWVYTSWYDIPSTAYTVSESGYVSLNDYEVHQNGTSGGLETGKEFYVEVAIKDGNWQDDMHQPVGSPTDFPIYLTEDKSEMFVSDGIMLDAAYKDYNGNYHIGTGGMPEEAYLQTFHGDVNIKGDLHIEGSGGSGGNGSVLADIMLTNDMSELRVDNISELDDGGIYEFIVFAYTNKTKTNDFKIRINEQNSEYFFAYHSEYGNLTANGSLSRHANYVHSGSHICGFNHNSPITAFPVVITGRLYISTNPSKEKKVNYDIQHAIAVDGKQEIAHHVGTFSNSFTSIDSFSIGHVDSEISLAKGSRLILFNPLKGAKGKQGNDGTTPSIQIGEVKTVDSIEQASVTQRGTVEQPIFDFAIPKGNDFTTNGGDTLPIGVVAEFFGEIPPANWLLLDGSAVSRTDYPELFEMYGTKYGVGDGSTTFNLPNYKGRIGVGLDVSQEEFNNLGKTGGKKTHRHYTGLGALNNQLTITNKNSVASKPTEQVYAVNGTSGFTSKGNVNVFGYYTEDESLLNPYIITNYIVKAKMSASYVGNKVIDDLVHDTGIEPLSAKQGKVLNEKIEQVQEATSLRDNLIVLRQNADINWTATTSITKFEFAQTYVKRGNLLNENRSVVTVGAGVSLVKVNVNVFKDETAISGKWLMGYICKNGTPMIRSITELTKWANLKAEIILEVKEGDEITFGVTSDHSGSIKFPTYSSFANTSMGIMTVEVLG